jgi:hypothetical protein
LLLLLMMLMMLMLMSQLPTSHVFNTTKPIKSLFEVFSVGFASRNGTTGTGTHGVHVFQNGFYGFCSEP